MISSLSAVRTLFFVGEHVIRGEEHCHENTEFYTIVTDRTPEEYATAFIYAKINKMSLVHART